LRYHPSKEECLGHAVLIENEGNLQLTAVHYGTPNIKGPDHDDRNRSLAKATF
jgi:hypothetical protein